jgi:hypothetical protein
VRSAEIPSLIADHVPAGLGAGRSGKSRGASEIGDRSEIGGRLEIGSEFGSEFGSEEGSPDNQLGISVPPVLSNTVFGEECE